MYAVQYQFINHQLCALLSIYFKHLTLTYRATVHQCLPIIIRLKRNAQSQYILEVCFLCITSKVTKPVKLWASKEGSLFLSFSPPLIHSFLNSLLRSAKYLVKNIFFVSTQKPNLPGIELLCTSAFATCNTYSSSSLSPPLFSYYNIFRCSPVIGRQTDRQTQPHVRTDRHAHIPSSL